MYVMNSPLLEVVLQRLQLYTEFCHYHMRFTVAVDSMRAQLTSRRVISVKTESWLDSKIIERADGAASSLLLEQRWILGKQPI